MTGTEEGRNQLASALAGGIGAVGRSHRLHRPRGGFCARGYCQQCPTEGPLGRALACEAPADGRPTESRRDPLRIAGLLGERMEPWFYERRFLRPSFLRQRYLAVLRHLSAAAPLAGRPPVTVAGRARSIETDVVVVGGGPAGTAAAATVAAAAPVVLLTRGRVGGSLPKPGTVRARSVEDAERVAEHGGRLFDHTFCLGLYREEGLLAAIDREGPVTIRAKRLVVATGAYDRSFLIPGADLPGVFGLRAFELLCAQGVFRGARIGVFGEAAEAARAMEAAAVFDVPIAWSATPSHTQDLAPALEPDRKLLAVTGRARARWAILDGDDRRPIDVLVLAFTQPTYELQVQNGLDAMLAGSPPVVRVAGVADLPMLVVGEASGASEAVQERAAAAAAEWLRGVDGSTRRPAPRPPASADQISPDALVCLCEDVRVRDIDGAIADGYREAELLKRRSGATTGPCQGKLCLNLLGELLTARSLSASFPTLRPPIRPVGVARLGGGAT